MVCANANANKHTHNTDHPWHELDIYIYIFRYENSNAAASRIRNYTLFYTFGVHKGPSRLSHSLRIRAACFGHLNAASRYHVPCIYRSPSNRRREDAGKHIHGIINSIRIRFLERRRRRRRQIRPTQWQREKRESGRCALNLKRNCGVNAVRRPRVNRFVKLCMPNMLSCVICVYHVYIDG